MRISSAIGVLVGLILVGAASTAPAGISGLQRVANGLSSPIFVTHAPGDRERLFIVQRGGGIRILNLNTGSLEATNYLSISGVDTANEGGFLGMAFHPNYFAPEGTTGRGKFYVYVTIDNGGDTSLGVTSPFSSHIREYAVAGDPATSNIADPASARDLLKIVRPDDNHVGGWIGFNSATSEGQPQYLYIASGDGGGGNDSGAGHTAGTGNAQDTTNNMLGKMLRIDVDGDDFPADANRNYAIPATNPFKAGVGDPGDDVGDDEIWAYGLRNPFRDSFDRLTGDLWIGDVGQGAREEIDFQPANSTGGENYGWRLREGLIETPSGGVGGDKPPGNVDPVYDYNRDADQFGGTVVTGGYVYRGPDPSLQGQYFFLDSRNSAGTADDNYWMFDPADPFGTVENIDSMLTPDVGTPQFPVSFGEDAKGNLYIAYIATGEVYRIATNQLLAGDYNADGEVNEDDYLAWRAAFGSTGAGLAADGNANGEVDAADYVIWRDNLGASVHSGAGSGAAAVPEPAAIAIVSASVILGLSAFAPRRRQ